MYPTLSTIAPDGIYQLETQFVGKPDDYDDDTLALCRIAPPEYQVEVIKNNLPEGWLLRREGRTHIVGKNWWTLVSDPDSGELQLRVLAKQLPWFYVHTTRAGRAYTQAEELHPSLSYRPVVQQMTESNHFGVLVLVRQNVRGRPSKYLHYQVEFLEPTEDRHATPQSR